MHVKLAACSALALCLAGAVGIAIKTDLFPGFIAGADAEESMRPVGKGKGADREAAVPDPATLDMTRVADSVLEEPYRVGQERKVMEVSSGDTLMGLLTNASVSADEAVGAIGALEAVFDPRHLQVGQQLTVVFEHEGRGSRFSALELEPNVASRVVVSRNAEGAFSATEVESELETRLSAAAGTIESSLYGATNAAGVPDQVLFNLIRVLSYKIDFQRDLQPGDAFEILYEQEFTKDGELARNGNVLYATLLLSGREVPIYRFEDEDGIVDYYSRDGESVRRLLMRTPIDGARISSRFGMRHHPVLGYGRMHRGIDFAAPTGTPIYAAGDGVIEIIGRQNGFGNYIRIRHSGGISTAYAHMSRFAKGLSKGDRVAQGEIIGYVGSTGLATGPHLHYEILRNGSQINPLDLDLPTGRKLEGSQLAAFRAQVEKIDRTFAELMSGPQLASRPLE